MATHTPETGTTYLTDNTEWAQLLQRLPTDLEQSVRTSGAILRRREITCAAQFLRLILAYACNLPLASIATWAQAIGLARVSDETLRTRIRFATTWLNGLLTQMLAARAPLPTALPLRVRLTDGAHAARPGATGTDMRLHLTYDLARQRFDTLEVTDAHAGEGLQRTDPQPGDLVVGDRNYGTRAGVLALVRAGASVLVRIGWTRFPLLHRGKDEAFDLLAEIATVAHGAVRDWAVCMQPARRRDPHVLGRCIACRLPAAEAALARARARKAHAKSAKTNAAGQKAQLQPGTLASAEYLLLFTTVPAALASAEQLVALYRFRWQIELAIKRLKSLLGVARLTARDPGLVRAVLLAKLLLAVLVEDLCTQAEAFSPSGRSRPAADLPLDGLPAGRRDATGDYRRGRAARAVG